MFESSRGTRADISNTKIATWSSTTALSRLLPWWTGAFVTNILLLDTQIKNRYRPPSRNHAFKLEITFSVRGVLSPLLANICLHYALDLSAEQWRRRNGRGDIIIVRYCDDFVLGFQRKQDAQRFQYELSERLARLKLELHPEKTRLIQFERFGAANVKERHESGAPPTFNFLGLTHCCSRTRDGRFLLQRHTMRARLTAELKEIKLELPRRLHASTAEQGKWLGAVVRGHCQRRRITWDRMRRLADRWLPAVRIVHP